MSTQTRRPTDRTAVIRRRYDRVAGVYDWMELGSGRRMSAWRQALWHGITGDVLEVGVGTGANIPYYPREARVCAIDFSPRMLDRARRRARELGADVRLMLMDAQELAFADDSFDVVVATCVFCSVPDAVRGRREIRRVLRPTGRLVMLEHMRSDIRPLGALMDLLNPLVVGTVGANINRRTLDNVRAAGLQIVSVENLLLDIFRRITAVAGK